MVLLVGIEEVTNMKNVEKFKKEIKVGSIYLFYSSSLIFNLLIIKHSDFSCKQKCNGVLIQEMLDYIDFLKTVIYTHAV